MSAAPKPLMSLDDALAIMMSHVQSITAVESVSTWEGDGRVLAQDVVSELAVPALDNSSMDGYAVRTADLQQVGVELTVTQRIAAGQHGLALQAGQVARIFTGAPVPAGADAIVMQEHARALEGGAMQVERAPREGEWVRKILDPATVFEKTKDVKACQFCDFKRICQREI